MAGKPDPEHDAPRSPGHMEKKHREKVARVAERNRQAHLEAKKQRQKSDRLRAMNRGPNPR